jgi:hypothetical protein
MAADSNDNTRRGQLAARACASPSSASILSPLAQQDNPALSDLIAMVAELTVARSDLPKPIASLHTFVKFAARRDITSLNVME